MYGLVNKAIQELVVRNFGEATWTKIREKAGFEDEEFIGLKSYPDSLSYELIGAGSEELGLPVETLLEMCGEMWISHTATHGYENVLNLAGDNMIDFLHHLNIIHSKITHLMPAMRPPVFKIKNEYVTRVELLYQSERKGLEPMAVGILKGLGRRFGLDVSIRTLGPDAENPGFILFDVSW